MSFKIVKTIENGSVRLSIVPDKWEQDDILFWPPKNTKYGEKLIKDANSVPSIDWQMMNCTVKEKNLESLMTATKVCALYSNLSDTDAEVEYFERNKKIEQTRKKKRVCQTGHKEVELTNFNYNSEFELLVENEQEQEVIESLPNDIILASTSTVNSVNLNNKNILVNSLATNINNNNVPSHYDASFTCSENIATEPNSNFALLSIKLDEANNKIDALGVKLDYFIKSNAEVKTLLQEVIQRTNNDTGITLNYVKVPNEEINISEFNFPLNSTTELDELENKLTNKEFEQKMVSHFINIGGESGTQNGEKVAARLITELFTNSVLCQYTWKGISTAKTEDGRPTATFIKYEKIISLLFKLLQKADQNFTRLTTERYLQLKVFKRNSQRLKREMEKKRKIEDHDKENLNQTTVDGLTLENPTLSELDVEIVVGTLNTRPVEQTN